MKFLGEPQCHLSDAAIQRSARDLMAKTSWGSVELLADAVAAKEGIPTEFAARAVAGLVGLGGRVAA